MKTRKLFAVSIATSLGLILLSGCFFGAPQTVGDEFQGGSSVTQVTSKFLNDQWGDMNPDDIQLLVQLGPQVAPELQDIDLPEVTDEQAQTLVDFMDANNVQTLNDLQNIVQQAVADPSSVENYEEVRAVLEALAGEAGAA